MKDIRTVCARDCYDVCSLIVSLDEAETIRRVQGDPGHPVTRGILCPRSAGDRARLHTHRVDAPYLRENDRLVKTSWPKVLDLVAAKMKEAIRRHGPGSVLFLNYAGNTGLLANAFSHRLWHAVGATRTDNALCSRSGHTGISLHHGLSYGADPAAMPSSGLIVFWGMNPAVSASHFWHLARSARKSGGARIVVVDPVETRSARQADLWVRPHPGSDVALAYGVMHDLIESGKADAGFIGQWTTGFERLKEEARRWPAQRVEEVTGVGPAVIGRLAESYAGIKPSLTFIGYGLQHCTAGADQVRAVSMIPAVVGLHRGFFYGNGSAYFIDTDTIKGRTMSRKPSKVVSQVALAEQMNRGDFKFVYVSCMNPAVTLPDQQAFRRGMQRKDLFVAVHDTHWTRTCELADAVLPAATYLEKEDIVVPDSHRYVSRSSRVVSPLTDSRHEIWVMRQLAQRVGAAEDWIFEDPLSAVRRATADAFEGGGFDDLLAGKRLKLKCRPAHEYQTPSGRMEFYSQEATARGWSPLPAFSAPGDRSMPFTYLTSAIAKYTHTQFQEVYGRIPARVYLHPQDAEELAIADRSVVSLSNAKGTLRLEARLSARVPRGVVWSPKQLEGLNGETQNVLSSCRPQDIGAGARFNSTRVTISRE